MTNKSENKNRLVFAFTYLVGEQISILLNNGDQVKGVLVGANIEDGALMGVSLRYVIQDTSLVDSMNINWADIQQIFVLNGGNMIHSVLDPEKRSKKFQTDTDISVKGKTTERKLEAANDAWLAADNYESLNDTDIGNYDQFKINEQKFGIKSTYDERLYTTELNHDDISPEQRRKAEEIAKAIESKTSTNMHVLEERGQLSREAMGDDEEARFSSVLRPSGANAYVPPALRNNNGTGQIKPKSKDVPEAPPAPTTSDQEPTSTSAESPATNGDTSSKEATEAEPKPKSLNPVAKEWKPSAQAKTFVPKGGAQPTPYGQQHQQQYMYPVQPVYGYVQVPGNGYPVQHGAPYYPYMYQSYQYDAPPGPYAGHGAPRGPPQQHTMRQMNSEGEGA